MEALTITYVSSSRLKRKFTENIVLANFGREKTTSESMLPTMPTSDTTRNKMIRTPLTICSLCESTIRSA